MKFKNIGNKEELSLEELVYQTVYSSGIVSFREVTRILGCMFHLTKKQTFQLLKTWERKGWVKIHPYHGVEFVRKD
jgi:hypothetical protein